MRTRIQPTLETVSVRIPPGDRLILAKAAALRGEHPSAFLRRVGMATAREVVSTKVSADLREGA